MAGRKEGTDLSEDITSGSLTMGELVEHAYFLADEEENVVFGRDAVRKLINLGLRRAVAAVGYPLVYAYVNTDPSDPSYPIPDAMIQADGNAEVVEVNLYAADGTTYIGSLARTAYDRTSTATGKPTSYAIEGSTLYLVPAPDTTSYVVKARYKAQLDRYTDDQTPPLSDECAEAAVLYAVWQMKLRDDQTQVSDRWRQEYIDRIKALGIQTGVYKPSQF